MRKIENEKDMPWHQEPDKDGYVEHINCEGSRKHVISYDSYGACCNHQPLEEKHLTIEELISVRENNGENKKIGCDYYLALKEICPRCNSKDIEISSGGVEARCCNCETRFEIKGVE